MDKEHTCSLFFLYGGSGHKACDGVREGLKENKGCSEAEWMELHFSCEWRGLCLWDAGIA